MGENKVCFPLGIDNFKEIREGKCYYIDKTDFIRELLAEKFKVLLITRPRRFGKSLLMSMLENFFDIRKNSSANFEGLKISDSKELCAEWRNQFPVVFLTLKSVDGLTFSGAYEMFKFLISDFCISHRELYESEKVSDYDKQLFRRLLNREASSEEIKNSLYVLTRIMYAHYEKPVILLIDEYDVPLAKANENGYYREMLDVIRALFDKALKTNEFLKFAVITGCLKIAKESIFTGTNNFISDTIADGKFGEYIGFTEENVQQLLRDAGFSDHAEEIRHWYNGYHFGTSKSNIYCPWDVLNHVAALQNSPRCKPKSYWNNTSHNGIIRSFIERKDLWENSHINEDFETLLAGGTIRKDITENLTYDMLHSSADNLWSLLYMTGYLTQDADAEEEENRQIALKIPNEEIHDLFLTTVVEWFHDSIRTTDRSELFAALWRQDTEACSKILSDMIFETISYNDYKEEYYHAFVVGVLSFAGYKVKSNDEEGEGRPDIVLRDERRGRAIVAEVKRADSFGELDSKCGEALTQIATRRYAEAIEEEYEEVLCYGICFYHKRCRVKVEKYR